jgi:hypothetical protein
MATNENIVFSLEEYKNNIVLNEEDLNTFLVEEETGVSTEELESYYKNRCSVKDLQQILQYYGIPKKNMVKDEMLQCLLLYEMEMDNREIVLRRVRLWRNIRELKADPYFAKYISFNI